MFCMVGRLSVCLTVLSLLVQYVCDRLSVCLFNCPYLTCTVCLFNCLNYLSWTWPSVCLSVCLNDLSRTWPSVSLSKWPVLDMTVCQSVWMTCPGHDRLSVCLNDLSFAHDRLSVCLNDLSCTWPSVCQSVWMTYPAHDRLTVSLTELHLSLGYLNYTKLEESQQKHLRADIAE